FEAVRQHFSDIGHDIENTDAVYENGQARERTQILMDYANEIGGIAVGTGDLSELALGWATYNGDHMSMYGVNAGIPKTFIQQIVRYISETSDNKELCEVLISIVDTPISPELLPKSGTGMAQKTEDFVGPYELHDFYLYYVVRYGFSPKKILHMAEYAFKDRFCHDELLKWLRIFYQRFISQQFKRSCMPDGPKIGSVSLSPRGDFSMPSDAAMSLWQKELEKL
ncbi:MAG: NAD(+) synthase, partial [Oscillospiraceae bacterium]